MSANEEADEEVVAVPVRWRRVAQIGAVPVALVLVGLLVGPVLSSTAPRR